MDYSVNAYESSDDMEVDDEHRLTDDQDADGDSVDVEDEQPVHAYQPTPTHSYPPQSYSADSVRCVLTARSLPLLIFICGV